jgi:HK97 family phage major capsid protein
VKSVIETVREAREALVAPANAAIAAAEAESRNLTDAESAIVSSLSPRNNEEVRKLDERIADLVELAERNAVAAREVPTGGAVIRKEERTYSKQSDPRGETFLRDVAARFLDPLGDSAHRLQRHMQEERTERGRDVSAAESRAAATSAFAGLVVPQYLVDMVAPNAAAGRPFANICNGHALPADGMTVNISRITTATSAAAQSSENAPVSETNIDDTLLSESVFTVAGQQTLSRQAIDRGTGTEDVTLNDLVRRYHTALDSKLINDATTA